MATKCNNGVSREMGFVDHRTNQPVIMTLEPGGKVISIRPKGSQTSYRVTVEQIWVMGANNAVQARKSELVEARRIKRNFGK